MLATDLTRDAILSDLRRLQPQLRARGVSGLAIFGSRARGDHRPESDLDVLVDVVPGRKFSLLDLIGVSHLISDALGVHANPVMRRSLDSRTRAAIERDLTEIFHE